MSRALMYKPAARWPTVAALIGALTIEFAAVAAASLRKEEVPIVTGLLTPQPIVAEFVVIPSDSTPPDIPPTQLPPPPDVPSEFVMPEPPSKPLQINRIAGPRTTRPRSSAGPATLVSAQASLTNAPRPAYPYAARRSHQTGSGRFLLHFDSNGAVTAVEIDRTTGSAVLDQISESTFRRWRSQPGTYRTICVPVTFTLQGAQL